jgi:hypothetical protein
MELKTEAEISNLEKWFNDIGVSEVFCEEDVRTMLRSNIADSGSMIYVIWKMLRERFAGKIDATEFIHDVCFEFGKMHTKNFSAALTPSGFLKSLLSRADILAWDLKITAFNDERAVLVLCAFPYFAGLQRSGASEEERKYLLKEVFMGIAKGLVAQTPNLMVIADEEGISQDGGFAITLIRKDSQKEQQNNALIGVGSFLERLGVGKAYSEKDVTAMLREKVGDRGLLVYTAWKMMQKLYPWMDAEKFLYDACFQFGKMQTSHFVENGTPAIWLRQISSRAGILAWNQTIASFNEKKAVKVFKYCPHIEAARNVGATNDDLKVLCRGILMGADYGTIVPYPYLELSFPGKTYGEGGECQMTCIRRNPESTI